MTVKNGKRTEDGVMKKIRIGIYGYGNIAKSVEKAISVSNDTVLAAVFTRRDPKELKISTPGVPVAAADRAVEFKDKIDVMLMCGGSATDLPIQGPAMAEHFNIVDSYDTHAKIPQYLDAVGRQAEKGKRAAVISVGWDPGLFSMMRSLFTSVLPEGKDDTFWGPGVSQGHSDAIRRVEGVADGIQYTIPIADAVEKVRKGSSEEMTARQKHKRVCYIVAKEGADRKKITRTIKEMPNYFEPYDTEVNFITAEELKRDHKGMPHGGFVFRTGTTGEGDKHVVEFSLKLDSNPGFTGSVMVAYARAAFRLSNEKDFGAKTVFDIPLSYLSPKDRKELIKEML